MSGRKKDQDPLVMLSEASKSAAKTIGNMIRPLYSIGERLERLNLKKHWRDDESS